MTLSPTPTEGKATTSRQVHAGHPPRLSGRNLAEARRLQRRGFTLSEIAEELNVRDGSVRRSLYDEMVRDK